MVKTASQQGAKLVLLPKLMPSGYTLTEKIWDDEDFFNSFVLSSPEGKLLGKVRKNPPASVEAYFYTGGTDNHIIETDIGKIGVGICYENLLYDQMCYLYSENVDFILSPAAEGRPKPLFFGDNSKSFKRKEKALLISKAANKNLGGRIRYPNGYLFFKSTVRIHENCR